MSSQKRLLFITQKVNQNDPVLGFVHGWLNEFAKKWEKIFVICLEKGEFSLPQNVAVFSLGKEKGYGKFALLKNFFSLIWKLRKEYSSVFVHMNQEYVLLAGIIWRLTGKKISLWRNHPKGNLLTKIAVSLSCQVFCTSEFSYTRRFSKTKVMPAGIDTETFQKTSTNREPRSVLYLGRITPVKKIEKIVEVANSLDKSKVEFSLSIYGDPTSGASEYYKNLLLQADTLENKNRIGFYKGVTQIEAKQIYNTHEILLNTTVTGSFDKVVPEMMACEGLVLTTNASFGSGSLPGSNMFVVNNDKSDDFENKLQALINLPKEEKEIWGKKLRQWVVENHSLKKLVYLLYQTV